jgi:hypothetical protein
MIEERGKSPRMKARQPVEIHADGSAAPLHRDSASPPPDADSANKP